MNYNEGCVYFSWLPDGPGKEPWCEIKHVCFNCDNCTATKYTTELEDAQALLAEMLVDFSECCEGISEYPLQKYGKRLKDLGVDISPQCIQYLEQYIQSERAIYESQYKSWGGAASRHYLREIAQAEEVLNYVKM